jgi:hypothetical protein
MHAMIPSSARFIPIPHDSEAARHVRNTTRIRDDLCANGADHDENNA